MGGGMYYCANPRFPEKWMTNGVENKSMPMQSVKDFLIKKEEEFKWGDKVEIIYECGSVKPAIYIGKSLTFSCYIVETTSLQYVSKIRLAKEKVKLSRKQIAEKFGIEINQLEIED